MSGLNRQLQQPEGGRPLTQATQPLDKEKRKQLYIAFQNIVAMELPILLIDFPKTIAGINKRVKNHIANASTHSLTRISGT